MFVSSLKAKLLMVLMSATAGLLVLSAVGRHPLGRCPPEEVLKGQLPRWAEGFTKENRHKARRLLLISKRPATKHQWPFGQFVEERRACSEKVYDSEKFPKVSVVISFHDSEKVFNILHTVESVLQRTPEHLLQEILLLDDNTRNEDLQEVLADSIENDIRMNSTVRIVRTKAPEGTEPTGLIRSRLRGISQAKAPVFVVLDSHMEVQTNWLEPLLAEITNNRRVLVGSCLDWLDHLEDGSWRYRHGPSTWKIVFDWSLRFEYQDISLAAKQAREKDLTSALESPATVGGAFAMDRDYFLEAGSYDEGMKKWGGENIDLSVRVWLSGGRVVTAPCSHVAHMEEPGSRAYRVAWGNDVVSNYRRFADVWLDEYVKYFYWYQPQAADVSVGDVESRKILKNQFKRNFTWFLENVFPELGIPDRGSFAYGGVKNLGTDECLFKEDSSNGIYWLASRKECLEKAMDENGLFWNRQGELRLPLYVARFEAPGGLTMFQYTTLYNSTTVNHWIHWKDGPLLETSSRLCLEAQTNVQMPVMTYCNFDEVRQKWRFQYYTQEYSRLATGGAQDSFPHLMQQVLFSVEHGQTTKLKALAKPAPAS